MIAFLSRLKFLSYNTWILAFILTLPFIFLFPVDVNKFKTEITKKPKSPLVRIKYADLDNDGKMEFIDYFNNGGKLSFSVHDYKGGLIDQWNLPGEYNPGSAEIYLGDIDSNGYKEIFGFTKKQDSVFCHYAEPLSKNNQIHSIFIDRILPRKDYQPDFYVPDFDCIDLDGDSLPEAVFVINAGYSLEPRKIYSYDFQNKQLSSSPRSGLVIHSLVIEKIGKNNRPVIFGTATNGFNIPDGYNIPYSDTTAWLMIYDHHLNYKFTPLGFKRTYASLKTETCIINGEKCFFSLYSPARETSGSPKVMIHDINGNFMKSVLLEYLSNTELNTFTKKNDHTFYIIGKNGFITEMNPDLRSSRQLQVPFVLSNKNELIDLNHDGHTELIVMEMSGNLLIISDDLKYWNEIPIAKDEESISNIRYLNNSLYFQTMLFEYFINYGINLYYYARLPIYTGIYLFIVLIIYFIKKTQESRIREKYEFMSQVRSLEMRAFRNQMDPHFTLNTFNLMASLFNKGKTDDAMNAFMKFSKLIRQNLEHTEDLTRTLKEEMEAVESFLEITKLRFRDKIVYTISGMNSVLQDLVIPKMIVLTHVENAVKHGLIPKTETGHIRIEIESTGSKIIINIEDDGIGRKKASEIKNRGSGLGLGLLEKLIDHLNKDNREKITQEIIDLTNSEGIACGTRILIKLPLNLS